MSGICGCIGLQGGAANLAESMLDAVSHRGPDLRERCGSGPGLLAVASRRPAEPAPAPIGCTESGVCAVVDGVVTNAQDIRQELRAKGCCFPEETQQALTARLYEEYGEAFAEKLEGSYALAVWDGRARRLILLRDRLGTKPLYYARLSRTFLFGSTIRALLRGGAPPDIRYDAIDDYLTSGSVPGPGSIYRDVSKLPPAHLLALESDGRVRLERYWDLLDPRWDDEHRGVLNSGDRSGALWSLLKSSVDRMAPQSGAVGVFLSGGPDAGAVLAALHELGRPDVRTYTAAFRSRGYDESDAARLVAQRFGATHQEILVDTPSGDVLSEVIRYFDEPYAHPSAVALYLAAQKACGDVRVVLGGESADDLFAGNTTHQASQILGLYNRLPGWLSRGLIPWAAGRLPLSYSQLSVSYRAKRFVEAAGMPPEQADAVWKQVIRDRHKPGLHGPILRGLTPKPKTLWSQAYLEHARDLPTLNRLIYAEMQMSLVEDVLNKHDRMSAAFGLENYGPFTDRRLVEFAFRLPVRDKVRGLRTKYLLRKTLEGRLPHAIAYQRKMPFNSPSSEWLSGGLREFLRDTLSTERLRAQGVLDQHAVHRMISDHLEGRADYGPPLWSLLMLTLWLDSASQ